MNTEIGRAIFQIEREKEICQKAITTALETFRANTGLVPQIELITNQTISGQITGIKIVTKI